MRQPQQGEIWKLNNNNIYLFLDDHAENHTALEEIKNINLAKQLVPQVIRSSVNQNRWNHLGEFIDRPGRPRYASRDYDLKEYLGSVLGEDDWSE